LVLYITVGSIVGIRACRPHPKTFRLASMCVMVSAGVVQYR
jgi:hypothetical protein